MKTYERHELSALDGDMTDEDFQLLVESIDRQGVLEPVMFWEGKILDGWHRYLACQELKIVNYRKMEYEGNDPSGYVFAKSLRKSKSPFERAALVIALRNWETKRGRPSKSLKEIEGNFQAGGQMTGQEVVPGTHLTQQATADAAGVSLSTMKRVAQVVGATPEVQAAVKAKKIGIRDGAILAALPMEDQNAALSATLESKAAPKIKDSVPSAIHDGLIATYELLREAYWKVCAELKQVQMELESVEAFRNNDQVKELMKVRQELLSMTHSKGEQMNKNAELQGRMNVMEWRMKKDKRNAQKAGYSSMTVQGGENNATLGKS